MQTEFVTARFPEGAVPRTSDRASMLRRTRTFIRGEARIREAGGGFGPYKPESLILGQVRRRVDEMGVGPKLIIQRRSDGEQLSIREVALPPKIPDLGAAPLLELLSWEVVQEFGPILRDGGLYVCRFVDGTTTVSKHGHVDPAGQWKGAARDWFVREGGMTKLKEVYRFQVGRIKHHNVVGAHVIVDRTIYTHPAGEAPYGGAQHFHTHEDIPVGVPCR